jgi:hypothetical protein
MRLPYSLVVIAGGDTSAFTVMNLGITRVGGGAGRRVVRSRLEPSTE